MSEKNGLHSRKVALKALIAIEKEKSYANLSLPSFLLASNLSIPDKAFVTELVYGSIRMRGTYDRIIDQVSSRAVNDLDVEVLEILRMGTHQLLSMRVADHAAVDTAVRLTKEEINQSSSGFVNAILRKISKSDLEQWLSLIGFTDKLDQLSIRYSHPRWILESYLQRLGDISLVEQECIANNNNPKVCLVSWPGEASVAELLKSNESFSMAKWVDCAVEITGDPAQLLPIKNGQAGVQDQGSYLVTKAFVEVPVQDDLFWLDLCAGPGGKSALLDRWATQKGIGFIANEISPHRAKLMKRATQKIVIGDGLNPSFKSESFSRILIDAPCSGLGALRRRPDARWRKNISQLAELVQIQRGLLTQGANLLSVGGVLGYVTCSPHPIETVENVSWFLNHFKNFEQISAVEYFPSQMNLPDTPSVQLWPGLHQSDGMFLSLFKRQSR